MNLTNLFLEVRFPDYMQSIRNFQTKVDGLISAAKANSLGRSSEAYSQVVSSCVACHQGFRREQFVKANSITK
jgi:hypothetical protein